CCLANAPLHSFPTRRSSDLVYDLVWPQPPTLQPVPPLPLEPEVQQNLILCNSDTALFEYNLIFRVGCPTEKFDMKRGYIDFEIRSEEHTSELQSRFDLVCRL